MFLFCNVSFLLFLCQKKKVVAENVFDHNVWVDGLRPTKKGGNWPLHNKIVLHACSYQER